jgi:uncharacterized membrane protein YhaH (DUF805 family)
MNPKLSDLWRWDGEVNRSTYLFWGLLLAVLKYNLDRLIAVAFFDQYWSVFKWSTLQFYLWQTPWQNADQPYFLTLLVVSLPFIWSGGVLTLRRLRSLDCRPYWILLFFIPVVKLFFFATICLLQSNSNKPQSHTRSRWVRSSERRLPVGSLASAFIAIGLTSVIALVTAWLGAEVFDNYGWSIFVGIPFSMGFLSALLHSLKEARSVRRCIAIANLTVLIVAFAMLLLAFEGIICLLMAAPIALTVATIGGLFAYAVQSSLRRRDESPRLFCSIIVLMPLAMGLEKVVPPSLPLLAVKSSVIVNAPPEKVWRNVVSFSELPPPTEMIFKLGIAYPIRAEIHGCGVGAVRHCNFSTGPFVEPIEVWDEPRLLKFSVTKNPEPMQEWTPYRDVHPAHLQGYLESRAGQFLLTPLEGGRTLLEGTTWYHHHLWPANYWQVWSDQIIHTIHKRVLNHVKELSENPL